MKAAILGITGYTAQVLARLLANHEKITQIIGVSSSAAGETLQDLDPGLRGCDKKLSLTKGLAVSHDEALTLEPEIVFSALPHLKSAEFCKKYIGKSLVIDLSADFRMEDPQFFTQAYGEAHGAPEYQDQALFGLCEWYKTQNKNHRLIANPGCYPTATLLPLLPLLKDGIIQGEDLVINAMSGVSGAGKKALARLIYTERSENACAYSPGFTHRHAYEIKKELEKVSSKVSLSFTPHLVPMKRGMEVTTSAKLSGDINAEAIEQCYQKYYGDSPFITLRNSSMPETREVRGSNSCHIAWQICQDRVLLFSVTDNLMKGASGQAVQNMNLSMGWAEETGLSAMGEV